MKIFYQTEEHAPKCGEPVDSFGKALAFTALGLYESDTTWIIPLNDEFVGGLVLQITGTSVVAVIDAVDVALRARHPDTSMLIVYSFRPNDPMCSTDLELWNELRRHCNDEQVELLEWFVVSDNGVQCPRDLANLLVRFPTRD